MRGHNPTQKQALQRLQSMRRKIRSPLPLAKHMRWEEKSQLFHKFRHSASYVSSCSTSFLPALLQRIFPGVGTRKRWGCRIYQYLWDEWCHLCWLVWAYPKQQRLLLVQPQKQNCCACSLWPNLCTFSWVLHSSDNSRICVVHELLRRADNHRAPR